MKYNCLNGIGIFTTLNNGTYYCIDAASSCGLSDYPYYEIRNSKEKSGFRREITDIFDGMEQNNYLAQVSSPFITKRFIVIQMK